VSFIHFVFVTFLFHFSTLFFICVIVGRFTTNNLFGSKKIRQNADSGSFWLLFHHWMKRSSPIAKWISIRYLQLERLYRAKITLLFLFIYKALSEWNFRSMSKYLRLRFHYFSLNRLDSLSTLPTFPVHVPFFLPSPCRFSIFFLLRIPFKEHFSFATRRTGHDNSTIFLYRFLKVHYGARKTTPSIKT